MSSYIVYSNPDETTDLRIDESAIHDLDVIYE